MDELVIKGQKAKIAAQDLAIIPTEKKNEALRLIANELMDKRSFIIQENEKDLNNGRFSGLSQSILDRLMLNEKRIEEMVKSLQILIDLDDPIGEIIESWERPNGLRIKKVRVPLGVIGMIYEARPNVTVDAASLAIKTGNAILLRGSSSAIHSNKAIIQVIHDALRKTVIPPFSVQLIEEKGHEITDRMLRLHGYIDVLIPRGSAKFIQYVVENSSLPVIETGAGNCHVYIDQDANYEMAKQIIINAKTQRPSVCNAAETLLVHRDFARNHLPELITSLEELNVECRGCTQTISMLPHLTQATEEDWATEYLDLILAVKVVENVDEAIEHINRYGTKHSEVIVTNNRNDAKKFMESVDAAVVYHNASSRFTDGFEFGFGAEIGISTQKLHARGPMGLKALTSYKYMVLGNGQIR
ncbi:glutamate-5-semialdehyde dehydrogenase [Tepidibacillus fermentans]|uniref:Gamma-glutamyl phosphate reductase n=1 Tax=Tepidibacillus fermentans TaxID=1281767 RepID=A0A4R3KKP3_9BACI|nr:glutamate-5-semialdehyde dehydrogenase [Tepidibacillus fermentans]TCS84217.1 glutamate-5-semialdehyde dehydrogenase [Tepidibacillus fermentans]